MNAFLSEWKYVRSARLNDSPATLFEELGELKKIFVEPETNEESIEMKKSFDKECEKGTGAQMFLTANGRLIEGIDFADRQARAAFLIGVPNQDTESQKIQLKKKFLDKRAKKLNLANGGKSWYDGQTAQTINQSIGRVIRNANDFGMIFLIDDRFDRYVNTRRKDYFPLSSWCRDEFRIVYDLNKCKRKIDKFFSNIQKPIYRREKNQPRRGK